MNNSDSSTTSLQVSGAMRYTKILTEIWQQFWDKMMVKIYAIEIIFKSYEPFQSYELTGQATSARKAS